MPSSAARRLGYPHLHHVRGHRPGGPERAAGGRGHGRALGAAHLQICVRKGAVLSGFAAALVAHLRRSGSALS